MNTATITRKTRKFGWGYNCTPVQKWNEEMTNSHLYVPTPTKPDYVGTIKQVYKAIDSDRNFKSLQGGTYYSTAFFIDGKRINTDSCEWLYEMDRLIEGEIDSLELPLLEETK